MLKAVIFDRDGTLNRTTRILRPGQKPGDQTDGYVLSVQELVLFPAVKPALTLLRSAGITPFVFTQQNCIGKGLVTAAEITAIHQGMNEALGSKAAIEGFYVAWNGPGEKTDPRAKPGPAMIFEILAQHGLEAEEVLVAGDTLRDYQSAKAAGAAFAWIAEEPGRVSAEDMRRTGCTVFNNVLELAENCLAA